MHLLFAVLLALTQPWLVVSDLHVEPFDRSPQPASYGSDTNWALFDATVAQMRRVEPNPKVVVIPGDFLAHHFRAGVSAAEAEMQRIERSFAKAFPRAQFLITLGNNDDPCGDYSTAPNTPYASTIARIWAPLVNRNGAAPDFARKFARAQYYSARLPFARGQAVVLDDVYWSIVYHPCGRVLGNPGAEQLAWLSRTLARTQLLRSVIVMHIPPGIDEISTLAARRFIVVPYWQSGVEAQLESVLVSNVQRVPFVIAGHMHQNEFRIAGGVPVLVAPSISPVYRNNPAFLKLDVREDGTLGDYAQYAYDTDSDRWMQVLDFDKAFRVGAFTADSLRTIHERLANDPSLRQTWSSAMVGGSRDIRADSNTWRAFWCAQTSVGSAYAACAGDQRRTAAIPIAAALLAAIVLLALVALGLRLATQRHRA
jgi:predicted phosphodiesterase